MCQIVDYGYDGVESVINYSQYRISLTTDRVRWRSEINYTNIKDR